MAVSVSKPTAEPRAISIGPQKIQEFNWTSASGDVSLVITADALTVVDFAMICGAEPTAQTISGNVVTVTIPAANAKVGQALLFGK